MRSESCPAGSTMRELFNSETGAPSTKMVSSAAGMWGYGVNDDWGSNATSGLDSWLGWNPDPGGRPVVRVADCSNRHRAAGGAEVVPALPAVAPVRVVPGRASGPYLDGGTVEVDAGSGPVDAAALPWTNGPAQTLSAWSASVPNEWAGRKAFAGDSFGWTASQLDLSSFAGKTVKPSFTVPW